MASKDPMELLLKKIMEQLGVKEEYENINKVSKNKDCCKTNLTPAQILVIAALLGGVLEVDSIRIDKEQEVAIFLTGSLKRPKAKTQLEQIMDQIGCLPFDQVMKGLLGRY
ncbi:hypothetical protein FQB35_00435 [Crassaminicella thermophila]|uniref:Uncharacterized protein n=1 Tax=Crassaminicella thermophila TaxID=2599308 RepID=A0A5C0SDF7_CRATE|nr:hypothetical protein [Crassaminicella thermophila]QEK10959.1 hypothetical protein FQB35_00435 [Crassaminicella thermophila]